MSENSNLIRDQNDQFRKGEDGVPGKVVFTSGALYQTSDNLEGLLSAVRSFEDFNNDNDPHGEHDFGSLDFNDTTVFWKIDLYEEPNVNRPNESPIVFRVLTIMLASEY